MFRSLIAYSNGVNERWKGGIVSGIHLFIPKLFKSAVAPQLIRSVFCSHFGMCWFAVCLFDVHRSAFSVSLFATISLSFFYSSFTDSPPQDSKEKLKHCIILLLMVYKLPSTYSTLPVVVYVVLFCAFGTVSVYYISFHRRG